MRLEIIKWDDHPAGGCGGRGSHGRERGDRGIARVHRDVGSIRSGAAEDGIISVLGRRTVERSSAIAVSRLRGDELNLEIQRMIGFGRWRSYDDERLGAREGMRTGKPVILGKRTS